VSVEAISWALNLAPVPADRAGRPSSACKFVLVGLTNHAGPDGTGALPSVATLIRYTGLSERTVRTCLDRLESEGIISSCDPDIVAARIKRADRRPQGWDLDLSLTRGDLGEPGAAVPGSPSPGPPAGTRLHQAGSSSKPSEWGATPAPRQARRSPGATVASRSRDEAQPQHRRGATPAATRCNGCTRTVQRTIPGAVRRPLARACAPVRRRAGRRAGRRVLRLPPGRLDAHLRAASQAHPSRRGRARQRMDARRAGRVHRRQHPGRAQSVRGAHRPALTRRTAPATPAAPGPAAVVRRVRPGHPDARLRRRRAAPVPALQARRHSQPGQSRHAAGPRPYRSNCGTAARRSPSVRGHQSCVQTGLTPNAESERLASESAMRVAARRSSSYGALLLTAGSGLDGLPAVIGCPAAQW
jgi:Helix-turn-helix domain